MELKKRIAHLNPFDEIFTISLVQLNEIYSDLIVDIRSSLILVNSSMSTCTNCAVILDGSVFITSNVSINRVFSTIVLLIRAMIFFSLTTSTVSVILKYLVVEAVGLEPTTLGLKVRYSDQLSYASICGATDRTRTCNQRIMSPLL